MNNSKKKITELYNQSYQDFHVVSADYTKTDIRRMWSKEKFALSIIYECLQACNRVNQRSQNENLTKEQIVYDCMSEIEKVFDD